VVTVQGSFARTPPLWGQDTVRCRFDASWAPVPAWWGNGTAGEPVIICAAPAAVNATAGLVTLEVSPNGQQFSTSAVLFRFFVPPTFGPPSPSLAPLSGEAAFARNQRLP
jgi:hypothetical protein